MLLLVLLLKAALQLYIVDDKLIVNLPTNETVHLQEKNEERKKEKKKCLVPRVYRSNVNKSMHFRKGNFL